MLQAKRAREELWPERDRQPLIRAKERARGVDSRLRFCRMVSEIVDQTDPVDHAVLLPAPRSTSERFEFARDLSTDNPSADKSRHKRVRSGQCAGRESAREIRPGRDHPTAGREGSFAIRLEVCG